jgi:prephenate dehydrogenase (NADP+)
MERYVLYCATPTTGAKSKEDVPNVTVLKDGHAVSRISDWIMYSVEAEFVDRVVAEYGPCTYT